MRLPRTRLALALIILCCAAAIVPAQRGDAPNVIQIFMPDGSQPNQVMRFTMLRDDGRVETLFTDSKGKYSMTGDMVKAGNYTVVVETDRQTYDTTTTMFRIIRTSDTEYVTVFLRALKGAKLPPAKVLDVSALDTDVPEPARAAYQQGMDLIVKQQIEPGIESLKRAVSLHPKYLRALNDLGVVYLKLNRLDEAAETFKLALKVNSRFAYGRLNLGMTLHRQGKHNEAARLLGDLYKENSVLPGLRASYADALYDAGHVAEARKLLVEGLEDGTLKRAEKAELHYKLGRALSREGKMEEGVKELRQTIELEPTAVNAHLLLGGDLMRLKQTDEAERSLLRAYELGGAGAGHAQLLLGQLYFEQKKYDLALRAFEQYLKDVPAANNAAQIRDVVAKLKTPALAK
jgi:tetratricopeptide (TPR) repeat protein